MRTLADLRPGESARLTQLGLRDSSAEIADILIEAGFVPGTLVTLLNCAPGGCPRIYDVDGAEIAIRRSVSAAIQIGEV